MISRPRNAPSTFFTRLPQAYNSGFLEQVSDTHRYVLGDPRLLQEQTVFWHTLLPRLVSTAEDRESLRYINRIARRRQLEERLRLAGLREDHGLLFPSGACTPISGGDLKRAFKALLKRASMPQTIRFHDLRHTCATLLLQQGVNPKFVQDLLGHGDVSLTLNVYSHIIPDMGDTVAGAIDDVLG